MTAERRRVAVVGSGVAGLTAAYVLQRDADVTLFEADDRIGGHAHTHDVGELAIDSGFIVHNERTYPNLLRLFGELGVRTQESEMSMSVRCEGCGLEYAGARRLPGLFAQRRSLVRGRYLAMLGEILRFHRHANRVLDAAPTAAGPEGGLDRGSDGGLDGCPGTGQDARPDVTLAEFVRAGRYSRYFTRHFLLPVVSAVWSTGDTLSARYPARYLFAFLRHHGMLSIGGSPTWRTVTGGSRSYVELAAKNLTAVHVSTPVRALRRTAHDGRAGVELRDDADTLRRFDAAVVATHPAQALRLLAEPTRAEADVLGALPYSRNETVLHTDDAVLPRAPGARASWNLLKTSCADSTGPVLVSYDMNRLMRLPSATPHVVTLNATDRVRPGSVLARMVYEHPVYTPESLAAQRRLPELSDGVLAYAGAYHGWGFHEDGCASGVRAAATLGSTW